MIYAYLETEPLAKLTNRLYTPCTLEHDEHQLYYSEVALSLLCHGTEGTKALIAATGDLDGFALEGAIEALGHSSVLGNEVDDTIVRLFESQGKHSVTAELLFALARRNIEVSESQLARVAALGEAEQIVIALNHYLAKVFPRIGIPLLLSSLADLRPRVRMAAIDDLEDLSYTPATSAIVPMMNDPDPRVADAAKAFVTMRYM